MAISLKKEEVKGLRPTTVVVDEIISEEDKSIDAIIEAAGQYDPLDDGETSAPIEASTNFLHPDPLTIILDVLQTLITKVEGLSDITEKEKVIGKLKGALEILSKNCN